MAIVEYQPISAHTLTVYGYRHMNLYARLYGTFSVSGLFFHQVHSTEDGMQMLCVVSLQNLFGVLHVTEGAKSTRGYARDTYKYHSFHT